MTVSDPAKPAPRSLASDIFHNARYYLSTRFGLLAVAAAALGLGAYLGWGWLVAAGVAPLILAVLPCMAMCALSLCMNMNRKTDTSSDEQTSTLDSGTQPSAQRPLQLAASTVEPEKSN